MNNYNTRNIAYILLYFPKLTETFIADEIETLSKLYKMPKIYSLLKPKDNVYHKQYSELSQSTEYIPSILSFKIWKSNIACLIKYTKLYFYLYFQINKLKSKKLNVAFGIKRNIVFFKSIYLSENLRKENIDIIHSHFAWLSGVSAYLCSRLLNIPYTITIHAFDIFSRSECMELVLNNASKVISISEYNKMYIKNTTNIENNIDVVHCGIDLNIFNSNNRHKSDIMSDFNIMTVGSLNSKKGHDYLIRSCSIIKQYDFKFHCHIIGEGKYRPYLERLIKELNLENTVLLYGALRREQIIQLFKVNDVFVLASVQSKSGDKDGIPVVLMEAAAMRLPIISTNVSGIPELIKHNYTGLLVEPNDEQAIADAILEIKNSPSLSKFVVENAYYLVKSEFNLDVNVKKLYNVLVDCVVNS